MPTPEKQVPVFISSTFRDMHAERDHLVTVVFPEPRYTDESQPVPRKLWETIVALARPEPGNLARATVAMTNLPTRRAPT